MLYSTKLSEPLVYICFCYLIYLAVTSSQSITYMHLPTDGLTDGLVAEYELDVADCSLGSWKRSQQTQRRPSRNMQPTLFLITYKVSIHTRCSGQCRPVLMDVCRSAKRSSDNCSQACLQCCLCVKTKKGSWCTTGRMQLARHCSNN